MSENPFATTDPWEVSLDTILPPGNHVVKIAEAQGGTSGKNNPTVELKLENQSGSIRDWLSVTQGTISKIVALAQAAGVGVPAEGDYDPETLRLTDEWIFRLAGKQVGIVVREEPAWNSELGREDPTKTRSRVQGYVTPQKIAQAVSNGQQFKAQGAQPSADIPF